MDAEASQYEEAFALAKAQAACDGAFPEALLKHWFDAAWTLCARMIGLVYPPFDITERVVIRPDGSFVLSYRPSSDVVLYSGACRVMTLPPSLERSMCDPGLCCFCELMASYRVGEASCRVSALFLQAVLRVFTYLVENRGDAELDEHVLRKCGAMTFLNPDVTYVA